MLYKYYRYLLIVKILLLLAGGFLLFRQRETPQVDGGTVFYVDKQPGTGNTYLQQLFTDQELPTPWALLSVSSGQHTLHIPWTYDTEYVERYLQQPIPVIQAPIDPTIYANACKQKVSLTEYFGRKVEECHQNARYDTLTAIVLLVVGLLL